MKTVTLVCSLFVACLGFVYSGDLFSNESLCGEVEQEDLRVCEKHVVRKAYLEAYSEAYEVFTDRNTPKHIRTFIRASATVDLSKVIPVCGDDLECQYNRFVNLRDYYRAVKASCHK